MSKLYPCIYCTEDLHCTKYAEPGYESWCVLGPCTAETPSNADRLRAMSDEELAEFLSIQMVAEVVHGWKNWLDWLKQEAEE